MGICLHCLAVAPRTWQVLIPRINNEQIARSAFVGCERAALAPSQDK